MADAEIEAMASVADALSELDGGARRRVLQWAVARYQVAVARAEKGPSEPARDGDGHTSEDNNTLGDRTYNHFAELFDAAAPATNEDKALVAAYWVQVQGGQETWGAHQLNKELKNLGHGLTNIAQALTSNINKQPKRVIQLKKSGSSQQARKTYKVTTEGIKLVQTMLAGEGAS